MNNKTIFILGMFLMVIFIFALSRFYLSPKYNILTTQELIPKKTQDIETLKPYGTPIVKYQIFEPGIIYKEIQDYTYLFKNDTLPKEVKFKDLTFIIKNVEIKKNMFGGFSAYIMISYGNRDEKIGFWHPGDPSELKYLKDNACRTSYDPKSYVCGGLLAFPIKQWIRDPTSIEKEQGIIKVNYQTFIFLQGLDYDFQSNNWNYAKISLGMSEEKQYPFKVSE